MLRLLLVLFVTVPLIELYVLISVGSFFGAAPTIILCLGTAALGAILLRHQGLETIARVQKQLQQGEIPAIEMVGGVILLCCGVLLLTPGLLTDVIGFACLLPAFRRWLARKALERMVHLHTTVQSQQRVVMEGEFLEDSDHRRLGD